MIRLTFPRYILLQKDEEGVKNFIDIVVGQLASCAVEKDG